MSATPKPNLPQRAIGLWIVTVWIAAVGITNLLSAVTPGVSERMEWLRAIFPFEVSAGGNLFAALSGFFLLSLATNLLRRKRLAWWLAVFLLGISLSSHLVKGLDYEEG
ncbi:hypothetical protein CI593_17310, partial [Fischerella thermalis CCMEE 5194]